MKTSMKMPDALSVHPDIDEDGYGDQNTIWMMIDQNGIDTLEMIQ